MGLEDLQSTAGKFLAEGIGKRKREPDEVVEFTAGELNHGWRRVVHRCRAWSGEVITGIDNRRGCVIFLKVLGYFCKVLEWRRLGAFGGFEWKIDILRALFVAPFLNGFLIADHADAGLVDIERHITEAFGVEFLDFKLVVVEVGRPKKDPAHAALGNDRGGCFWRLHGNALKAVKFIQLCRKNPRCGIAFAKPKRAIRHNLKK